MSSEQPPGDPATRRRICEAALRIINRQGVADITMAAVARAARVSRQALYLHFADRAALLVAVVRYADEQHGVAEGVQRIRDTASGIEALREMAAQQATLNPTLWPLALVFDSVRRQDAAAERSWQDRLADRLEGCRAIVSRLDADGTLRPDLSPALAADVLWTLSSLRTWEDLVLLRGWTPTQYRHRLADLLITTLCRADVAARESRTSRAAVR